MVGLDKLGRPCTFCAATIIMDPRGDREVHCPKCGHLNTNNPVTCDTCDEPVGLKLKYDVDECQERGMTFRSEEHTSELQSQSNLVCRLLLEKKNVVADKR